MKLSTICFGTPAATICVGISSANCVAKTVLRAARPTDPPIWRKNVRLEVATPRALIGTAFWTTIVNTPSVGPMPRPVMNIHDQRTGSGVSAWMFDIRYRPTAMTARPAMITGLYFPVLETRIPDRPG